MGDKPELCPTHSDLPETLKVLQEYQQTLKSVETFRVLTVPKSKLAENDFNLSADRYREVIRVGKQKWPMVALGDERYFSIESGGTPDSKNENYWNGDVFWATLVDLPADENISIITNTKRKITQEGLKKSSAKIVPPDSIIVSSRATIGRVGINKVPLATNQGFKNIIINERNSADTMFVAFMAKRLAPEMEAKASGGTFKEISKTSFSTLKIPLPPLEIQRQIVDEIAAHQRILDGARQVVAGWKPDLELEDDLEKVKLGDVCDVRTGKLNSNAAKENGEYPFFTCSKEIFKIDSYAFDCEAILLSGNNASGDFDVKRYSGKFNAYQRTYVITIKDEFKGKLDYQILQTTLENNLASLKYQSIGGLTRYLTLSMITSIEIPLPPLEIQHAIVARLERERLIVAGNRQLIRLYEEKIKKVIEKVWQA